MGEGHPLTIAQNGAAANSNSNAVAVAPSAAVVAAPATPVATIAAPSPTKGKGSSGGGGVVEGFMAMLSFRDESVGDQIKFGICLLLVLYLLVSYVRWTMIGGKIDRLEAQLQRLEAVAQQLLAQAQQQAQSQAHSTEAGSS